jgi:transcriptional regulator with XRE-family HTH domain
MGELAKRFGQELRRRRKAKGLTQPQLADASGLSEEWVRRIERGEASPSFDTLDALGSALDVSVADLFSFSRSDGSNRLGGLLSAADGLSDADVAWLEETVRRMPRRKR